MHIAGFALVLAAALIAVRGYAGQPMFEKTVKALVAPVGVVWVILILAMWLSVLRRQPLIALLATIAWLVLTIGGNAMFVSWLGDSLQSQWIAFDVDEAAPVTTLLVLGGGTESTPAGKAQGGAAADRVLVAARMALAGKAERIVCSGGRSIGAVEGDLTAGEESRQLLVALGVSDERIELISGRNTSEEMQLFGDWLDQSPSESGLTGSGVETIGIVTSAWHMERALRLARARGIEATAIPCDFRAGNPRSTPHLLVPGAVYLLQSQRFLHEHLARLASR